MYNYAHLNAYAQLGSIQFDILSIDGINTSHGYKFEEMGIIDGKPQLQATGNELDIIDLKILFSFHFCTPQEEYMKLKAAADKKEPLAFVVGDTGIYKGYYVITNIDVDIKKTAKNGDPLIIEISLKLKEFVKDKSKETIKKKNTQNVSLDYRRVQYVR